MSAHAPIAVFLYNRPDHARRLFASLRDCPEFFSSPLHVFCDGPRTADQAPAVRATRAAARELAPPDAVFHERDRNAGLAGSLTAGITRLTGDYGRVIVLEDDLELSPVALTYFNIALDRYVDEERVMHISGYMFPTGHELPELFFYREMSCWGWATWKRAWRHFEPDSRRSLLEIWRAGRAREFNINDTIKFDKALHAHWREGRDSWAVRWYASAFLRRGLALHPARALVRNTGLDGSGVHCDTPVGFDVDVSRELPTAFPADIAECDQAVEAMMDYRLALEEKTRNRGKAEGDASLPARKKKTFGRIWQQFQYRMKLPF